MSDLTAARWDSLDRRLAGVWIVPLEALRQDDDVPKHSSKLDLLGAGFTIKRLFEK